MPGDGTLSKKPTFSTEPLGQNELFFIAMAGGPWRSIRPPELKLLVGIGLVRLEDNRAPQEWNWLLGGSVILGETIEAADCVSANGE